MFGDFRRLTQFNGREPRRQFWPYAAVVFLINVLVGQALAIPVMSGMMSRMFALMSDPTFTNRAEPSPFAAQGEMMRVMAGEVQGIVLATLVAYLVLVLFIAAAVSRRLHDTGISGWWGMLPVPFAVLKMALMPAFFSAFADAFSGTPNPPGPGFSLYFSSNLLSLASVVALIVLLCRSSATGETRFSAEAA